MKKLLYALIFSFVSHASDVSELLNPFSETDRLEFKKYVREGKEEYLKEFFKEMNNFSDCDARLCVAAIKREVFGTSVAASIQTSTINAPQQNHLCDVDSDDDEMEIFFMGSNQNFKKKYRIKPRK